MGVRIQPPPIEIPEADPFKHDLLGRKESAEVLTSLLGNMEGPCVLAVDAAWGTGKTTFLEMWTQHLRNEKFTVVQINAWETDFTEDPFLAISAELTKQLERQGDTPFQDKVEWAKKTASEVAIRTIPALFRFGVSAFLGLPPALEGEIAQGFASFAKDRLTNYGEVQVSVAEFKESLQELAQDVACSNEGRPLIIMIDELDRCRPSYAVELLEVAKHLFSVDHVVFVLAVNRSELAHSVKAIYGEGFGAEGYLRRFFDIDFRLPDLERKNLITFTIDSSGIQGFFERPQNEAGRREIENVRGLLTAFLDSPDLDLRIIEQSLHHLGLVFTSLRSDVPTLGVVATVALIIRTHDFSLFQQFINGDVDDAQLADTLFARSGMEQLRQTRIGVIFEAFIILASLELKGAVNDRQWPEASPLWRRYEEELREHERGVTYSEHEPLIRDLRSLVEAQYSRSNPRFGIGFLEAVQRIDMLSNDLM